MRSLWKGAISFGLVHIPVRLYRAVEEKDVHFHYLHRECQTPIQYKKWCPTCGREVASHEIVRGYEYEKGRYVIFSEEDLEAIPVASARTVEILDFVSLEQIDPIYFEKSYFLEPAEGGQKAYHLLRQAMLETGRIALVRVALRNRESLAALRVYKNRVLTMVTIHFPDEIRSYGELKIDAEREVPTEREVSMARTLIGALAGDFDPERYHDRYREALLGAVRKKIEGEELVVAPTEIPPTRDLMEALRSSLALLEQGQSPLQPPGPSYQGPP
ncbi:MAG: Ku protein [Firmicutes bacterium]|nr:Ku protein [Bacillota bacterium]MCL5040161.1 Ku protein [Bacillota bacterium]